MADVEPIPVELVVVVLLLGLVVVVCPAVVAFIGLAAVPVGLPAAVLF